MSLAGAQEPVVRAAGGVVVRTGDDGERLVAVVHRPRYDDWSLPKGKLREGESDEVAAVREVLEELGVRCELDRDLGTVGYRDGRGRPKVVRYFAMRPVEEGRFAPGAEVDEVRWVPLGRAAQVLSYAQEREVIDAYRRLTCEAPAYVIRHAKAGSRSRWTEDDRLRPLSRSGRRQAEELVRMFCGLEVARIVSSPYVRCVQTVRPLALDRGLPLDTSDLLAEGSDAGAAIAFLDAAEAPLAVCTHGDVVEGIVLRLAERGTEIVGPPVSKKGSVWVLERRDGAFHRARYLPPSA